MQQSVNGNIKHKTCDNSMEGDSAGDKPGTVASSDGRASVGLGSSCCVLKKCFSAPLAYDKEADFNGNL